MKLELIKHFKLSDHEIIAICRLNRLRFVLTLTNLIVNNEKIVSWEFSKESMCLSELESLNERIDKAIELTGDYARCDADVELSLLLRDNVKNEINEYYA